MPEQPKNTIILETAFFIAEQLLKYAPAAFTTFREILTKDGVTIEELRDERNRIAAQTYETLVPHTRLPPTPPD